MQEENSDEEEFSVGIRSTTRIQDVLRKTKYEQLEGILITKKGKVVEAVKVEDQQEIVDYLDYGDEDSDETNQVQTKLHGRF